MQLWLCRRLDDMIYSVLGPWMAPTWRRVAYFPTIVNRDMWWLGKQAFGRIGHPHDRVGDHAAESAYYGDQCRRERKPSWIWLPSWHLTTMPSRPRCECGAQRAGQSQWVARVEPISRRAVCWPARAISPIT